MRERERDRDRDRDRDRQTDRQTDERQTDRGRGTVRNLFYFINHVAFSLTRISPDITLRTHRSLFILTIMLRPDFNH